MINSGETGPVGNKLQYKALGVWLHCLIYGHEGQILGTLKEVRKTPSLLIANLTPYSKTAKSALLSAECHTKGDRPVAARGGQETLLLQDSSQTLDSRAAPQ